MNAAPIETATAAIAVMAVLDNVFIFVFLSKVIVAFRFFTDRKSGRSLAVNQHCRIYERKNVHSDTRSNLYIYFNSLMKIFCH